MPAAKPPGGLKRSAAFHYRWLLSGSTLERSVRNQSVRRPYPAITSQR